MDTRAAILANLDLSMMALKSYVQDFTDDELRQSPGEGCNCVAWQLGHLIASQASLLNMVDPNAAPLLPDGFESRHSKENSKNCDKAGFYSASQYLEMFDDVNHAVRQSISKFSDTDLDNPSPEGIRAHFPTVGSIFVLMSAHAMMHAGQFVPLRRRLDKPVVI